MKNGQFNPGHYQMLWADFGRAIYRFKPRRVYRIWKLLKADNYLNRTKDKSK